MEEDGPVNGGPNIASYILAGWPVAANGLSH